MTDNGMKRLCKPLTDKELYLLQCTAEYVDECSNNDVIYRYNLRSVRRDSIQRLQDRRSWLNDEILNYYFTLLKKRNDLLKVYRNDDYKCTFFSTWFYQTLMGSNESRTSGYNYV